MNDTAAPPPAADAPPPQPTPSLRARLMARLPTRRRVAGVAILLVVFALTLVAGYTALTVSWAYSEGDRSGTLLKISEKGWVCKTWEGELLLALVTDQAQPGDAAGISSSRFLFTVPDDAVAEQLNAALGKKVVLHYTEHKGVPSSCFGDTPYYVEGVRVE
jgi:hypothetical protein